MIEEFLVVDLETAGFTRDDISNPNRNCIVEIGIVLCNSKTKEITPLFDEIVRDANFTWNDDEEKEALQNSWIFENSEITFGDVMEAIHIEEYRDKIQELFDKYPVTSYNKDFDLPFFKARKFKIPMEIPCVLKSARKVPKNKNMVDYKLDTVYKCLFKNETEDQTHRAIDDATQAGQVAFKLIDAGVLKLEVEK